MTRKPLHHEDSGVERRDFLRAAPASLAAGVFPTVTGEVQPANETTTSRLRGASELSGLEFTDAEHDLMRAAVDRSRAVWAD